MLRLVDGKWDKESSHALSAVAGEVLIICPFIKAGALKHILHCKPDRLRVITRFDLDDFAQGVSDIAALRMLLNAGARVRGVKNLHAKLYVFGTSRAIITFANLTEAAPTEIMNSGRSCMASTRSKSTEIISTNYGSVPAMT